MLAPLRVSILGAFSVFFLVVSLSWGVFSAQLPFNASAGLAEYPDLYEASITELQAGLEQGHFTSVDLVTVGWHKCAHIWYLTIGRLISQGLRR